MRGHDQAGRRHVNLITRQRALAIHFPQLRTEEGGKGSPLRRANVERQEAQEQRGGGARVFPAREYQYRNLSAGCSMNFSVCHMDIIQTWLCIRKTANRLRDLARRNQWVFNTARRTRFLSARLRF